MSSIPRNSIELIRIHLAEREVDQAIAIWEERSGTARRVVLGVGPIDLEVAQASEKARPETALEIYRAAVKRSVAAHNRESYQAACQFLKKIRPLLKASGRANDWNAYITRLREEHRALRALHEELKKAGL